MVMNTIKIDGSRRKILLLVFLSLFFVVFGFFLTIIPETFKSFLFRNVFLIRIAGIFAILFFGAGLIISVKEFFVPKFNITITKEGIIDNSSYASVGMIFWKDIKEIDIFKTFNQKFIIIIVKNPNDYIERQTNLTKRKLAIRNYKAYKSPILISSDTLKIKFDELYKLLQNEFDEKY